MPGSAAAALACRACRDSSADSPVSSGGGPSEGGRAGLSIKVPMTSCEGSARFWIVGSGNATPESSERPMGTGTISGGAPPSDLAQ